MARLLMIASVLFTLHLGGASVLSQDAQDAFQFAHTNLNSLSNHVTYDIVNLHNSLSASAASNS